MRGQLEKLYEEETGLSATRGAARIDRIEQFLENNDLQIGDIEIFNDTQKMRRDYRAGIQWYAGKQCGNTICLGYTSGNSYWYNCKNAIFARSDKIGE